MTLSRASVLCVIATIVTCIGIFFQFNFTEWANQLYFNGDNITLALVIKSIIDGQPFHWVFSSQTFLFPEGPLFFISYWLSADLKTALLTNAYLNLALLGIPIYLLGKKLLPKDQDSLISFASFFSLCSLTLVLESTPDINASTILTPVFFVTYYSGVIIVSLFGLVLLSKLPKSNNNHRLFIGLAFILTGGLTYSSDPLYLLQVIAPLVTISLVLYVCNQNLRKAWALVFILAISGLIAGLIIRHWTSSYAVASVGSYIDVTKVGQAFTGLFSIIRNSVDQPFHGLLWLFWGSLFVIHSICTFIFLNRNGATDKFGFDAKLVHLFCIASPLITISGVLLTGNFYTRYLLPLPVFTLLGFSLILPRIVSNRISVSAISGTLVLASSFFLYVYLTFNREPTPNETDVKCYNTYASRFDLHPVGGFWTSRYLTLYSPSEHQVFQVFNDFKPHNWLSNKIDHTNTSINAVIVDHEIKPFLLNQADTEVLGKPTIIYTCQQFRIYVYDQFSDGFRILNERIRQ